ncbi:MAG: hypothetical protein AAF580_15890 [Pseudomonadota bacterium]
MPSLPSRFRVAVVLAACLAVPAQLAAAPAAPQALTFVETLYRSVQAFGGRSDGFAQSPAASVFFAQNVVEAIQIVAPFDPLTGAEGAPIERFQLRPGAELPDAIVVEAAVLSGGAPRLVRLTVVDGEAGLVVADLAGADWTLDGKVEAASAPASTSLFDQVAPAPAASASGAAQTTPAAAALDTAALIAADEAASAASALAQSAAPPGLSLPFEDPFDGTQLGPEWAVINPDENSYVVERGEIFVITSGADDRVSDPDADNIFALQAMPAGDFDAVLDAKLDARSGEDGITLALWDSPEDYIALRAFVNTRGCGPALYLSITNQRPLGANAEPVSSSFTRNLFDKLWVRTVCSSSPAGRAYANLVLDRVAIQGFRLVLSKRGNTFGGRIEVDLPVAEGFDGGPTVYRTRDVARFELPGSIALLVGQNQSAGRGEGVGRLDRFALMPAGAQ